jgi:TolB-like protein
MASHYRLGVAVVVGFVLGVTRMAPAASSMRVAVMEFQRGGSSDAQLDSLGKGLQSMVTTDLAQVSSMELVERSRMHDIEAEQKLARSGMVDPKTAVKIGKLAGATHLVTGTYIIVGGKMRLDARLFGVSDGKVLLAEQIEGDKDAFFELEKQLVNKVIGVIGVKIPPKERAEVARVHTADFDAFRRFSDGIGAFDDKKYEEAMAALKEAGTRDASFKLASITLAEYERVITELRTKADAIDSANAQLKRLGDDKSIQEEAAMVKKLYAISTRPGADAQIQRLAALHILALIYGARSRMSSRCSGPPTRCGRATSASRSRRSPRSRSTSPTTSKAAFPSPRRSTRTSRRSSTRYCTTARAGSATRIRSSPPACA